MPITIKDTRAQYTRNQLQQLSQTINIGTASQRLQLLTRFDFQNKKFANMDSLVGAIGNELSPEHIRWMRSLTPDSSIQRAVAGNFVTNVVLVRGTTQNSATRAIARKSAGGEVQSFAVQRPTNSQAISQVGGSQPGQAQVKLPEFTTSVQKADKWAKRGGFFFIKISASYLTRGDVGQNGWVVNKSAPIIDGFFVPHPNPVSFNVPNAD